MTFCCLNKLWAKAIESKDGAQPALHGMHDLQCWHVHTAKSLLRFLHAAYSAECLEAAVCQTAR